MSEIDDILKGAPDHKPGAVATKAAAPAPTSEIDQALKDAPAPARGFGGWARDIAATAVKGAIAVPEAVVGLADIPTGGAVGKFLENEGGAVGFRPKQAKEIVNDWHSDATKQAQQKFQEAEGLGGKLQAAVENPSVIATTVGESLPSMFAGGALAKGVGLAAPALAGRAGLAAAGEGAMMAGSQAESIRQQTEDGLLTGKQAALAAATGLAGGAISALGARAGKALGVGDVDTMIAGGATQGVARDGLGIASRAGRGALAEGVLEELPQSLAETALGNIALGKDVTEGMDEAAVLGTLSGGLMGGAAGAMSRPGAAQAQTTPQAQAGAQAFTAGQPMTPPAELNSVTEKAQWVKGWQDAAAASMGLDGESADQQPVQTAGDVLPDVPGGMATVQRTYDPRAGQRPPLATMSADVGGNGMDFEPSPEFDRNIRTFDPLKENEPTKGLGYNPLAGTPTVYPDGSVALNGDQEFQYRTGAVAPQKRSEQMGLNPSAGPMSAAAATAVDTGAADQVQQQAVLAQAAEAAAKAQKGKAPAADPAAEPASPAKRVAHRVTGFMNGDPASPVRTMVMASSQEEALDLAAKSSPGMVPDRAEPVSSKVKAGQTTTQPATGAPNRVLETAQTVQTGQEEPKAPAAAAGVGAASAADARTDEQATTATPAATNTMEPAATGRAGVSGVDQPQPLGALSNVQNTPISTAGTEAQASPVEARAPEGGNAASSAGVPAARNDGLVVKDGVGKEQFDTKGLKPGTPEYEAAFEKWISDQSDKKLEINRARQRQENTAAVKKRNGWRSKIREWFLGAKDGDTITDTGTGQSYKVIERTRKDGTKIKTLAAVDENGDPLGDGRAATGIAQVGSRVEGLDDGGIDDDTGSATPETAGQSLASSLGKQLEDGDAKTASPRATDVQADGVKIAEAANQAATSPKNDLPQPTEAQKDAGNYVKGHVTINGLGISIENPAGSKRRPEWPALKNHYGYFKGSVGADKDHVDVFMTDRAGDESLPVFVVDQVNKDGTFDEHKVVMGAADEAEARATYLQNYEKGWTGLGAITQMSQVDFKAWVRDPAKTKRPAGKIQAKAGDALPTATAPEHVVVGVDDRELGQIVSEFNAAQQSMVEDGERVTHVFDNPAKGEIVRLADKVKVHVSGKGWMTPAEAKAEIAKWKAAAQAQGNDPAIRSTNADKVVLSLFDLSGEWSKPWEEAGYQVYRFDIQDDPQTGDVNNFSTDFFGDWFGDFEGQDIYAILAACPCTDFAVSGARHFAAKDADGRTVASVKLVHQTLKTIEYFKPAVWALENPVGRIQQLGGLPDWRLSFDPNHLGDPYTKKTLIWGRFNGDLPVAPVEATEGSKMHRLYGGKSQATKNARSVTPEGFSYGFFMANNAHDNQAMALANKFDRLDRGLIEQAVAAGVTPRQIEEAVEDFYYMDLDDEAANKAIRDLIPTAPKKEPRGVLAKLADQKAKAARRKSEDIRDSRWESMNLSERERVAEAVGRKGIFAQKLAEKRWDRIDADVKSKLREVLDAMRPAQSQATTVKDSLTAQAAVAQAESAVVEAPLNDRDTFTLNRLNRETNEMEPVTFKRGEYVRYTISGKDLFGEIDGISQARREFSVDGLWYPMGFAYKAERPAAPDPKDMAPLSKVVEEVNAKNSEGLTDADRVPDQKQAGAAKFSTADRQPAKSVSMEKAQEVADKALSGLGLNGVVSIRTFSKASDAGIAAPEGVIPMGTTVDGRIFLFAENLADELAVFRTVFHEVFHLGLSKSVSQGAYIQTMLGFLTDPQVRTYANRWKQTADGVSRKGTMPVNNWQALAVEEALSDIAEEMNADRDGTGTRYAAWVGRMASRLAKMADGFGLKTVAERIRAFTRTEAEQFVQDVMRRAGDAAPVQLRGQRFSQSQEAPDILSQDNSLDASAASDATGTVYTPATEAHQKAATAFAERLSKGRDSFVLMDAIRPSGARKQEAQSVANLAKAMFGREVVFVKFKGRPLFNGAVSTTDPGKVFVNIESARPMMAVLGHELLHELRKSNPAAYNQLAKTLKTVTKDDYIYEALLKKKYRDQGLNWTPQDISEELYGDIVGDNFMDPKFWEAIAGEKPVFAKQLYRAVMNWLNKIAAMFNRMKVRQDGSMVLTLAEQADGSRPFGTQKYLQDIEAARDAVAQAMGQFGKAKPQGQTDALSIADAAEQIKAFDVKSAPKSAWAHYRGMVLQALGRRQLVDLYAEELPQLETYNDLVQQMDAEKNDTGAEADRVAQDWGSLKGGMDRKLAELMHDATLAKMDPDKPMPAGYFKRDYDVLKARFDALSPEAKVLYRKARDMYLDHYKAVQQAIKDRVERSEMSEGQKRKMMADLDDKLFKELKGVYFPLARFGQYVIVVKDANGEVVNVTRAETVKEAEQARKELQKAFPASSGNTVGKVLKQAEFNAGRDAVGKGFMADLMNTLDAKGVDDELRDTVAQLYLSSLPDLSWAKHGIHRKGTPGFSQDARRAFAQNMFHGARYLAKLRHADRLQDLLIEMQDHIKAYEGVEEYDSVQAQQVVDEMVKRHEWLMNPKASPVSTALTSFGFLFHMGLSPASAMVNLTQTALVAYPQMGAKWGFARAGAALTKASEETVRAKNDLSQVLKGDELDAFNRAVKDGTIDVTMAHDLAGIAQGEDQGVMWKIRPVMRWASFMFHHAEKFNRQATFLAAYRLAKEANPAATQSQLYEQAKQATYDGHFDYSSSNRARIMQGNWQRVIFLFKQYAQSMVYTLARNAYQSVKALDPKERSQARKTLAGILAAHAAAAGVLGLPIVGPLLTVASWIGGDDDEPWDAEVAMQNAMAETIGPKAAEVVARGFSRLTPFDLSGRVALNKLILPDVQEGLEGKEWAESAMAAALGPVAGIGVNMARGAQKITEGHYMRGLEDMMPTALRGPLKAVRYASEGAVDKTRVVITDEVSVAGVLGQASGFAPSQVRRDTERRSAIYAYDRALTDRRSVLMRMFADAQMSGDSETVQEIRKDIAAFNEKNPTRRITLPNLMQSVRDRQRRIDQAEDGVYLPKNRRDAQEAVTF